MSLKVWILGGLDMRMGVCLGQEAAKFQMDFSMPTAAGNALPQSNTQKRLHDKRSVLLSNGSESWFCLSLGEGKAYLFRV